MGVSQCISSQCSSSQCSSACVTSCCAHLAHALPCWLLLCRLYDDRFVLRALWEDWRNTRYAAPDVPGSGVYWFRK